MIISLIFNSFSLRSLETVPSAPVTIDNTVRLGFFFSSSACSKYLAIFLLSLVFCGQLEQQGLQEYKFFFCLFVFLLIKPTSDLLAKIEWPVCIPKSLWILYVSLSDLCICHLLAWSILISCTILCVLPFPSSRAYSYYFFFFCGSVLYLLITRLTTFIFLLWLVLLASHWPSG